MRRPNFRGARGANAGDEYHELWALREALGLLEPGAELLAVTVEGVHADDERDAATETWDGVSAALDEIRRNAAGNVSVLARLLSTLETVAGCTPDAQRRAVLRAHGTRILATAERTVPEEGDRAEVREVHGRLGRALDPDPG